VLNAKFLNQTWRKHARSERPPENLAEFLVQTADAHVLKLEIRRQNGVWRGLLRARPDLNLRYGVLHERHLRLCHHYARVDATVSVCSGTAAWETTASLLGGELEDTQTLDNTPEMPTVVLKKEELPDGKDDVTEPADERRGHVVRRELLIYVEVPLVEANL